MSKTIMPKGMENNPILTESLLKTIHEAEVMASRLQPSLELISELTSDRSIIAETRSASSSLLVLGDTPKSLTCTPLPSKLDKMQDTLNDILTHTANVDESTTHIPEIIRLIEGANEQRMEIISIMSDGFEMAKLPMGDEKKGIYNKIRDRLKGLSLDPAYMNEWLTLLEHLYGLFR